MQAAIAGYEAKQQELQEEADGLRSALHSLQQEHRSLVNQHAVAAAKTTHPAARWLLWIPIIDSMPCTALLRLKWHSFGHGSRQKGKACKMTGSTQQDLRSLAAFQQTLSYNLHAEYCCAVCEGRANTTSSMPIIHLAVVPAEHQRSWIAAAVLHDACAHRGATSGVEMGARGKISVAVLTLPGAGRICSSP